MQKLYAYAFAHVSAAAAVAMRRCPCGTHITSKIDKAMAEIAALFRWDEFPECHFYFFWFFDAIDESHAVDETDAMCIRDDGRFSKHIPHDKIGTFSSDAGQSE